MKDFAAIDFETANCERSSVCSVGVVVVRDGKIEDTFYSLIHPEPNYYNYWCTEVHGRRGSELPSTDGIRASSFTSMVATPALPKSSS